MDQENPASWKLSLKDAEFTSGAEKKEPVR
jgi:hypothetical protein